MPSGSVDECDAVGSSRSDGRVLPASAGVDWTGLARSRLQIASSSDDGADTFLTLSVFFISFVFLTFLGILVSLVDP